METNGIVLDTKTDAALWDLEFKGKTAVCVALNQLIVGVLGVADTTKPDAAPAISALRAMGVDVWMVTGDNRTTAESIALQLEIPKDRIVASAMPGDKVTKVKELQDQGFIVAVVGDGINDSPALALSNLGIAVGAGSHVATEAADMILVRDKLVDVVMALHLAKVVFNRIKLNFLWASAYNVLAIPFAAGLWYPWFQYSLPPQYAGNFVVSSSEGHVLFLLFFYQSSRYGPVICVCCGILLSAEVLQAPGYPHCGDRAEVCCDVLTFIYLFLKIYPDTI